jgi:hypothetical protein
MVKRSLGLGLFACLVISAAAAANDPFVGNWKLDPSRSTPDKMTVESIGATKYTFNFGGGPETIMVDGTDQPSHLYGGGTLSVGIEGDTWKVIRKSGNGRPMLSAIWNVSKDGTTLTDRYTGFDADGSPHTVIYTYKREAGGPGFAGTWASTSEEPVDFVLALQIRPFEEKGLSIVDSSSQIMGNMDFAPPLVRRPDEHTLELMRKKSDGELVGFLHLELSPNLKTLTIRPHSAARDEPHVISFDRL